MLATTRLSVNVVSYMASPSGCNSSGPSPMLFICLAVIGPKDPSTISQGPWQSCMTLTAVSLQKVTTLTCTLFGNLEQHLRRLVDLGLCQYTLAPTVASYKMLGTVAVF